MSNVLTLEALNQKIEMHAEDACSHVEKLDNHCQQDSNNQTLLNAAIQYHNHEVMSFLLSCKETINYSPEVPKDLLAPIKYTLGTPSAETSISDDEYCITNVFGAHVCMQRSPLHQACRHANPEALSALIKAGADIEQKDILGFTPFELCVKCKDQKMMDLFLTECRKVDKKIVVSDLLLQLVCFDQTLYQRLVSEGQLTIKAKRFAFNYACALLDQDAATRLLEEGLTINKTITDTYNPLSEVCTSQLVSLYGTSPTPNVSKQKQDHDINRYIDSLTKALDEAGDNDDMDAFFEQQDRDFAASRALKRKQRRAKSKTNKTASTPTKISEDDVSQRLAFIDFLIEQGLNVEMAISKAPYGFLDQVKRKPIGIARFRNALKKHGYSLSEFGGELNVTSESTSKAAVENSKEKNKAVRKTKWTWELAGESVLLAETIPETLVSTKEAIVRITHNNVYGPFDDVKLYIRMGDPNQAAAFDDAKNDDSWIPMTLVEELLYIDGESVRRSTVQEPIYDETPWDGTYEAKIPIEPGKHSIEIMLVTNIEGMSGILSDWLVNVK